MSNRYGNTNTATISGSITGNVSVTQGGGPMSPSDHKKDIENRLKAEQEIEFQKQLPVMIMMGVGLCIGLFAVKCPEQAKWLWEVLKSLS